MCDLSVDCSILANETGRKRHLTDKDGFEKPRKHEKIKGKFIETSKFFEHLREDEAKPGTRKEPKRIPLIVAKMKKKETAFINAVRTQTGGLVSIEYIHGGLKIRTSVEANDKAVLTFHRDRGENFFTFHPNPIYQVRYVQRGLPPSN